MATSAERSRQRPSRATTSPTPTSASVGVQTYPGARRRLLGRRVVRSTRSPCPPGSASRTRVAPVLFEFDLDLDRDGDGRLRGLQPRTSAGSAPCPTAGTSPSSRTSRPGDETAFFGDRPPDQQRQHRALRLRRADRPDGRTTFVSAFDVAGFAVDYYTSGTVRDAVEFEAVFRGERYAGVSNGNRRSSPPSAPAHPRRSTSTTSAPPGPARTRQGVLIRVFNGDAATENFTVPVDQP